VCEKFASKVKTRTQQKIPMQSFRNDAGEVILHQHSTPHCFTKISEIIKNSNDSDRHYSLAILTHTNEQVLTIYFLLKSIPLLKNEIQILLKQEGFQLFMLDEIQQITDFLEAQIGDDSHIIEPRLFQKAKESLVENYKDSSKLGTCLKHLRDFEPGYQTITLSIWCSFIIEVTIEQFDKDQSSKIVISTIHRAKGKEFDEVHVVIQEKHHSEKQSNWSVFKTFAKNYTQMLNTHNLHSATIEYIAHWPNQNSAKTSKNFLCRLEFSTRQQK
tara:strand:+ start:2021 stop:2836 length:816 start_codon:yes stop_codon:yes gene_type:complete